jgi:hypothetical protein
MNLRNRPVAALIAFGACSVFGVSLAAQATAAKKSENPGKVPTVAVVGCLQEPKPGVWMLVNAGEPAPSHPNAPTAKEVAALPKSGKRTFHLIGVTVFNLPVHRGHTVAVKGLHVPASPSDRLNVTSVTMVDAACSPPAAFD